MTEAVRTIAPPPDIEPPGCAGTTTEGNPCGAPPEMCRVDPTTGEAWCFAHDPTREQERRLATTRGGLTTRLRYGNRGLHDDELGDLKTPADAARWSEVIARATATGRLNAAQANAAIRAVDQFVKARDLGTRETRLSVLEAEIAALRKDRKTP